MGKIDANITGEAPFGIVVRKIGETTGNRCTGACNSFPVTFTTDPGDNQYYFIVTDSNGCVKDSREIGGGVSNLNCDVIQPSFTATMNQPQCVDGNITTAYLVLSNIANAVRYKVWYCPTGWNTCDLNNCENSSGFINSNTITIQLNHISTPQTDLSYIVRLYGDNTCNNYKSYQDFIATPAQCGPVCNIQTIVGNPSCG